MARRKGFLAEYNRQMKLAEQRSRQKQRADEQARRAQLLEQKRSAQQLQRMAKASIAQQKEAAKRRKQLYIEARQLEVENLNSDLQDLYEEIDTLLRATLLVDDFVDLEALRKVVVHPPFSRPDLEQPIQLPPIPHLPPEPVWVPPVPRTGVKAHFDNQQKQQNRYRQAQVKFQSQHSGWRHHIEQLRQAYEQTALPYRQAEQERRTKLEEAKATYRVQRQDEEIKAEEANNDLDALIKGLNQNAPHAIQSYVEIVLSNSIYPSSFPVTHSHSFDNETGELTVEVLAPKPDSVPTVKEYKYVKTSDEIKATNLPKASQKERYNNAIAQVAVRTMHEVYEADRYGHIETIALKVAVESKDPGTGLDSKVNLVAAASERVTFCQFNLERVVPLATLEHLGAEVSSNVFGLKPISDLGVRTR